MVYTLYILYRLTVYFISNPVSAVELCKRRVLSVDLPSVPNHYTDCERTLYMSSLVPFDNISMVCITHRVRIDQETDFYHNLENKVL